VHACCLGCYPQFEMKDPYMDWQNFESMLLTSSAYDDGKHILYLRASGAAKLIGTSRFLLVCMESQRSDALTGSALARGSRSGLRRPQSVRRDHSVTAPHLRRRFRARMPRSIASVPVRAEVSMQNLYQLGMRYAQLPAADRRHMSNDQGTDGKVVADQIGHTLDVNRNVYTRLAFDRHAEAVNKAGFTVSGELMSILE